MSTPTLDSWVSQVLAGTGIAAAEAAAVAEQGGDGGAASALAEGWTVAGETR